MKSLTSYLFIVLGFLIATPAFAQKKKKQETPEVYTIVEEMPRFPGCEDQNLEQAELKKCAERKMLEHIYSNLEYPQKAIDSGTEGMAVISFVIQEDGSLSDIKLLRSVSPECDSAALKVINEFPNWIPGKQAGKPVPVHFNLPIRFKMKQATVHTEVSADLLKKLTPKYNGLQILFCTKLSGEILDVAYVNAMGEDEFNTKNMCGFFFESKFVEVAYEINETIITEVSETGEITEAMRNLFRNAKPKSSLVVKFRAEREEKTIEKTKIIIVE